MLPGEWQHGSSAAHAIGPDQLTLRAFAQR